MPKEHSELDINTGRRRWLKSSAALVVAGAFGASLLTRPGTGFANEIAAAGRIGIVYFSKTGNTRFLAQEIARMVNGSLVEIRTVKPYPENYRATTRQARIEQDENARPEILSHEPLVNFDTLFIGYPNWWGTMPMAMSTLLENSQLAGKTIMPFCTHQGSALGSSVRDLRSLCPDSTILSGHAQTGGDLDLVMSERSVSSLHQWVDGFNLQSQVSTS